MRFRSRKSIFIPVVLFLAALPLGLYVFQTWRSGGDLAEVIAELDRRGEPWRLADLEARRKPIADERNSALIIRKAKPINFWKAMPDGQDFDLLPCQELPAPVNFKLREALVRFEANIQDARRLTEFPEGQFSYKIAPDVISTLIPHVQDVRDVAFMLRHDALLQIQQGDFEQAAASCKAAVHASRALRDELFMISHVVRQAMVREAANSVERMCAQGQPNPKLLRELGDLFAEEVAFDGWRLALEGERAGMHELFTCIAEGKAKMNFVRAMSGVGRTSWRESVNDYIPGPSTQQSHAWLLRHHNELLAAQQLPPMQRAARSKELSKQAEQAPDPARGFVQGAFWKRPLYPKQRLDAKLNSTIAGLAAERFRQKCDAWPQSLADLSPEFLPQVPCDPYTGDPLQFKATKDGIVIFSTGPDGAWQGNAWDLARTDIDWGERHEHEFRLWNVAKRRGK